MLVARKKENFIHEFGNAERLEQSYLWDQDQAKEHESIANSEILDKKAGKCVAVTQTYLAGKDDQAKHASAGGTSDSDED